VADETQFNHDKVGHILADNLLLVPNFQRKYSWEQAHVAEFLADLRKARAQDSAYFMGTVVFVADTSPGGRMQIVDGQQRLATTAVLLIALRDRLNDLSRNRQAQDIHERLLKGYVLALDDEVERLQLCPADQDAYDLLLDNRADEVKADHLLRIAYDECRSHLQSLAPSARKSGELLKVVAQLEGKVQVLTAVASSLSEAYVIFETLNDRGADLTTADLLKNYLFSSAKDNINYVRNLWVEIETQFDRPTDLVKFIRYEYISRHGPVTARGLYRAIQEEVGEKPATVKAYVRRLREAQKVYQALRDADNAFWNGISVDVSDAILAYKRFGFESSVPLLLALFSKLPRNESAKILIKVIGWSVRSQFAGLIGAQQSESAFGNAAAKVSSAKKVTQGDVRKMLDEIIPGDPQFKRAFASYGAISNPRAKYLLAMLERANSIKAGTLPVAHKWNARNITVEHVMAASTKEESAVAFLETIGNLALLQRSANKEAEDKAFKDKKHLYLPSEFALTVELAAKEDWQVEDIVARTEGLADLAILAWPNS